MSGHDRDGYCRRSERAGLAPRRRGSETAAQRGHAASTRRTESTLPCVAHVFPWSRLLRGARFGRRWAGRQAVAPTSAQAVVFQGGLTTSPQCRLAAVGVPALPAIRAWPVRRGRARSQSMIAGNSPCRATWFDPALVAMSRSLHPRSVRHGIPRWVVSSGGPVESVTIVRALPARRMDLM